MAAVGPVIRAQIQKAQIERAQIQHSPQEYAAMVETNEPQMLEVRTGPEAIYLCPSGWERMRLQWAFRHFRVLSPELLSRGDRRLIERLASSAVVKPGRPISPRAVFGVVERAFPKTEREPIPMRGAEGRPADGRDRARYQAPKTEVALGRALPATPAPAPFPWREQAKKLLAAARELSLWMIHRPAMQQVEQWKGLAMLCMFCLALILVRSYGGHSVPPQPQPQASVPASLSRTSSVPAKPAPLRTVRRNGAAAAARSTALSGAERAAGAAPTTVTTRVLPQAPAAALMLSSGGAAPSADAAAAPTAVTAAVPLRPFVSELPQGRFATPVAPESDFVGTVNLQAIIGTDGSVKGVTVLSGDPKAAQAAVVAVKGWRYSPHEAEGHAVEAETRIGISFFGRDAVSVRLVR